MLSSCLPAAQERKDCQGTHAKLAESRRSRFGCCAALTENDDSGIGKWYRQRIGEQFPMQSNSSLASSRTGRHCVAYILNQGALSPSQRGNHRLIKASAGLNRNQHTRRYRGARVSLPQLWERRQLVYRPGFCQAALQQSAFVSSVWRPPQGRMSPIV